MFRLFIDSENVFFNGNTIKSIPTKQSEVIYEQRILSAGFAFGAIDF
jgi:hypothetical protein